MKNKSEIRKEIVKACKEFGFDVLESKSNKLPDLFIQPNDGRWGGWWLGVIIAYDNADLQSYQKGFIENESVIVARDEYRFKERIEALSNGKIYVAVSLKGFGNSLK